MAPTQPDDLRPGSDFDAAPPQATLDGERPSDESIRKVVERLARSRPTGGYVIERAAILAEGADSAHILGWIAAHAGVPEAAAATSASRGLHGSPARDRGTAAPTKPARYILPAEAFAI